MEQRKVKVIDRYDKKYIKGFNFRANCTYVYISNIINIFIRKI